MSRKLLVFFLLAATLYSVNSKPLDGISFDNPKQLHAVLVSAVWFDDAYCSLNYAPEAEIAQTYHLLLDNGVPAENIILFMNNSFTNGSCNPFPGTLYTDVNRSRNYNEGLKIDYIGEEVNIQNYLAVLTGDKSKVSGGSGRVLNSSENDRVFVSHEGHGGSGVLVISDQGYLTLKDLNDALKEANEKKMFKELTYYIMACHSGSMFNGQLDSNGNIYGLTAANPELLTYPNQKIEEVKGGLEYLIYVNTQFGHAWLSDSEINGTITHTLEDQYKTVFPQVNSTPSQYGNLNITNELISSFEGVNRNKSQIKAKSTHKQMNNDILPIAPIAIYLKLKHELENSNSFEVQQKLTQQLEEMEKERTEINQKVDTITNSFIVDGNRKFASLKQIIRISPQMITQVDCHHVVVKTIFRECKKIIKSPFREEFTTPMVNLCEHKFDKDAIIAQIQKQCAN